MTPKEAKEQLELAIVTHPEWSDAVRTILADSTELEQLYRQSQEWVQRWRLEAQRRGASLTEVLSRGSQSR